MNPDLATLLDEYRHDAERLRRYGDKRIADAIVNVCAGVERAATDWLTWLSETEALERSAKSPDYFRARRAQWELDGYARKEGRRWFYRRCIVPRSRLSSIQRAEAALDKAS